MCRIHIFLFCSTMMMTTTENKNWKTSCRNIFGPWLARVLNVCSHLYTTRFSEKNRTPFFLWVIFPSFKASVKHSTYPFTHTLLFSIIAATMPITEAETMFVPDFLRFQHLFAGNAFMILKSGTHASHSIDGSALLCSSRNELAFASKNNTRTVTSKLTMEIILSKENPLT